MVKLRLCSLIWMQQWRKLKSHVNKRQNLLLIRLEVAQKNLKVNNSKVNKENPRKWKRKAKIFRKVLWPKTVNNQLTVLPTISKLLKGARKPQRKEVSRTKEITPKMRSKTQRMKIRSQKHQCPRVLSRIRYKLRAKLVESALSMRRLMKKSQKQQILIPRYKNKTREKSSIAQQSLQELNLQKILEQYLARKFFLTMK